jgi:hypothetical protein
MPKLEILTPIPNGMPPSPFSLAGTGAGDAASVADGAEAESSGKAAARIEPGKLKNRTSKATADIFRMVGS